MQISFDNSQDDANAMFSIQKIAIPAIRKTAKGKTSDPFTIHAVGGGGGIGNA